MCHHAIIVTSWHEEKLLLAHGYADGLFEGNVSEITAPVKNGYASFFIPPDGSKEGWAESDLGDQRRALFIKYLKSRSVFEYVEVQYGDDDGDNKILNCRKAQEE